VVTLAASAWAQTNLAAGTTNTLSAAELIEDSPAHTARIAWWREAKFGMFIHWGLYSVLAGEWQGKEIPGNAEWIMSKAKIPVAEYEKLADQFNPVKFNADEWVRLAKDAGMKYLVFVAKHHDGFAMYDSQVDDFTIVRRTPWKRDPAKELAEACARHNIKFCVYYSHNLDWHEPNATASRDQGPGSEHDFGKYMRDKALPQVRELLTGYGPLGLVWFDMSGGMTREQSQSFADLVRSLQPDCLINSRVSKGLVKCDYLTKGDHSIPSRHSQGDWETPDTMNNTWGHQKFDTNWKSPALVVFNLVDVVSKGGNYLMNVGPTAEGLIPAPCPENLRAVGRWLKVNGKAVYGCGRSPFGAEMGAESPTEKDPKTGKPVFIPAKEWRCTTKPGKLYIHLFQWPAGNFELSGVTNSLKRAFFLSDPKRAPLKLTQTGDKVSVALPAQAPDALASVICLEELP
jgi:alpha-L-fucosidase